MSTHVVDPYIAKLYIQNDMPMRVTITDRDGALKPGLTVETTLQDENGTDVPGTAWPLPMIEVETGVYVATIPAATLISENAAYSVVVDEGVNNQIKHFPGVGLKRTGIDPTYAQLLKIVRQAGLVP